MDIRYVESNKIDRQRWDHCISQAFNGNIYACSWYLDVVCDHWDALVEGDYDRVFPLTYRKKYGIRYLYQPCFTQQLGLFAKTRLTPAIVDAFLDAIPGKFRLVEIQLNSYNEPAHSGFEIRMRPNLELELIQNYEDIAGSYAQNLRRNLKTASHSHWKLLSDADPGSIIKIFRKNRGKELDSLSESDYYRLEQLCRECKRREKLSVIGAVSGEGILHAGVIFVKSHNKIIFLFSATDALARESAAMPFIIDSVIREYSGTQHILDFEGSEDENLARFYAGFGAKEFKYPLIRRDTLPAGIRLVRRLF